jgi:hypothetical protein
MSTRAPTDEGNGAALLPVARVESYREIDTGQVSRVLHAALKDEGNVEAAANGEDDLTPTKALEIAIQKGIEAFQNGGGGAPPGSVPPSVYSKSVKKHNWGTIIATLLGAIGVALTSYYATEARSKSNEEKVEKLEPRVEKLEEDTQYIRVTVKDTKKEMGEVKTQQTVIADGIEQLKEEAQTTEKKRLEDKLEELERENRQLRRRRRVP